MAIDLVERLGNYVVALNNIREFRDRFIPVRRFSPEALYYLHNRCIDPELIYIDAAKDHEDLHTSHQLFPDAVLCGDDWDWTDEEGRYVMRENVEEFAAEHGFGVVAEGATWVLTRPENGDGQ